MATAPARRFRVIEAVPGTLPSASPDPSRGGPAPGWPSPPAGASPRCGSPRAPEFCPSAPSPSENRKNATERRNKNFSPSSRECRRQIGVHTKGKRALSDNIKHFFCDFFFVRCEDKRSRSTQGCVRACMRKPSKSAENWRYRKMETRKTLLKPVDDSGIDDENDRTT